jgi:nucleotide-binding universal stress UspA family protein
MSTSRTTVVVGVDGSPGAELATDWAATEAFVRGFQLELVHATAPQWVSGAPDAIAMPQQFEEPTPRFLEDAAAHVRREWPALEVVARELPGSPSLVLDSLSDEAALLVVGCHGHSLVGRLLMGSVSRFVVTHSRCPTVVVRGTVRPQTAPVAVGIDDSGTARAALHEAAVVASARRVPLIVVHAWHQVVHTGYGVWAAPPEESEARRAAADELTAELAAREANAFPDLDIRLRVRESPAIDAVLHAAREAQLLVLGAHGRGAFAGLTFGSVSTAAIHESACPVMIVPSLAA